VSLSTCWHSADLSKKGPASRGRRLLQGAAEFIAKKYYPRKAAYYEEVDEKKFLKQFSKYKYFFNKILYL
jgi:hypothetical protein